LDPGLRRDTATASKTEDDNTPCNEVFGGQILMKFHPESKGIFTYQSGIFGVEAIMHALKKPIQPAGAPMIGT
jgi:hypothetical protein